MLPASAAVIGLREKRNILQSPGWWKGEGAAALSPALDDSAFAIRLGADHCFLLGGKLQGCQSSTLVLRGLGCNAVLLCRWEAVDVCRASSNH